MLTDGDIFIKIRAAMSTPQDKSPTAVKFLKTTQ
jgi:hypothetical protein